MIFLIPTDYFVSTLSVLCCHVIVNNSLESAITRVITSFLYLEKNTFCSRFTTFKKIYLNVHLFVVAIVNPWAAKLCPFFSLI